MLKMKRTVWMLDGWIRWGFHPRAFTQVKALIEALGEGDAQAE